MMIKPFVYMFFDNKFSKKYLYCFLLYLFYFVLLGISISAKHDPTIIENNIIPYSMLSLVTFLYLSFIEGYHLICAKALITQNDNYILPFINMGKTLSYALKFLIFILLISFLGGLLFFLLAILTAFIYTRAVESGMLLLQIISIISLSLFFIVPIGCYMYFYMGLCWSFINTEKLSSFFKWGKVFELISYDKKTYISAFWTMAFIFIFNLILQIFVQYIIGLIFADFLFIKIFISSIFYSVVASYFFFVSAFLIAKSISTDCISWITVEYKPMFNYDEFDDEQ